MAALLGRGGGTTARALGPWTRRACAGGQPAFQARREAPFLAAIGMAGGAVGSVVGIGGGNVMVPLMTLFSRSMTQHQISATSLVAVVGTGAAAAGSFLSAGAVHLPAAALITLAATATAPLGARIAALLPAAHLRMCLAVFVLGCAPLVPLKGMLMKDRPKTADDDASSSGRSGAEQELSARSTAVVLATGSLAGLASGLLGIGGGVVLTPALALATDLPQQAVLGTSLLAMIIPSIAGALTHYRAGTILLSSAWPLALGAVAGAALGGRCAVGLPEEELRWVFAGVMSCLGIYMLRGAWRGIGK